LRSYRYTVFINGEAPFDIETNRLLECDNVVKINDKLYQVFDYSNDENYISVNEIEVIDTNSL
jgi:hypothetical protein